MSTMLELFQSLRSVLAHATPSEGRVVFGYGHHVTSTDTVSPERALIVASGPNLRWA